MKDKNKINIAIAAGFLAMGVGLRALNISVNPGILLGIFAIGLSLLFTSLYKHFKYGDGIEQDERTKATTSRALTSSWFATLIVLVSLMLADRLNAGISVQGVLSIIFFFMVFAFSAFSWYFGRKGDME